jgi:Rrf2 family protein
MISMKAKYGLRAALYLAGAYGRGPVLISELAAKQGIPKKFLQQILLELKNRDILQSKLGKRGGYFLGKSPNQITFGQIIRALDGPLAPVPCVSTSGYAKCNECTDEASCGIRLAMKDVRDAMAGVVDVTTLAKSLERSRVAASEGVVSYEI